MYNLLQGSEKRQLRLAELLIHTGDWMKLKDLAQELNCSTRILKYDLKSFEDTFSDFSIETSHRGVRLIFDDNKGLKNIYVNIFDSSNAFKLLEIIFFNETYSVTELAEILYVSSSTLYRVIHQMNQIIEKEGCHIETNPCKVSGREDKVRYFYYRFFFEKYTIMTWPYDDINHDKINDLLYFFMELTQFKSDFAYYNIAKLMLFVNLIRYKKEHYISTEIININLDDVLTKLESSPENADYFEIRYKLKINEQFIIQMFSPFITDGFSFNYDQLLRKINENQKINNEIQLLSNWLDELSEVTEIPLYNKDDIVFKLHNSIYLEEYDPRSGYLLYNRNQFFVNAIKKDFPNLYKQLYNDILKYRSTIGLTSTDVNINFFMYILFTEWKNLILELHKQSDKVTVLIISNRTLAHSYMLKDFLDSKFHTQLITEVYDDTFITKSILEKLDHDLILANFPIPELRNKESIYIENFPTQNEISQMQKKINTLLSENRLV